MHSVDLLEEAISTALDLGFEVRQEWLGEQPGGACRIGARRVLFVNLSMTAQEQLESVTKTLAVETAGDASTLEPSSPQLRALILQAQEP